MSDPWAPEPDKYIYAALPTFENWTAYYQQALEPQLQPDVTYEEYRENAQRQLERDRGAFTGETHWRSPAALLDEEQDRHMDTLLRFTGAYV